MQMKRKRTVLQVTLLSAVTGAMLCVIALLRCDESYCVHTDIDVHSGDIRVQKYTCFVKVSDHVTQTPFSVLVRKLLGERPDVEWRRVTTTGTFLRGVHVAGPWHDAMFMCDSFMKTLDTENLSEARQRTLLGISGTPYSIPVEFLLCFSVPTSLS